MIQIQRARALRKNPTNAEKHLWRILRRQQLGGFRFRRQVPMGHFIVDFVCHAVKVIVEADGGGHNTPEQKAYDQERTDWLNHEGYCILRFWNNDIFCNSESVLETILNVCSRRALVITVKNDFY